jgi:hypothetical protein
MSRRLKVYFARLGFFESVVAAPNQAEALQAWGVHQDLFAAGEACEATDKAARAALSHPGEPLKRAMGGDGPFALDADPPEMREQRDRGGRKASPAKAPPDRSALDAAEARFEHVKEAHARGEAEFYRRREALAAEEADARREWLQACKAAEREVQRERRAFAKAGGKP